MRLQTQAMANAEEDRAANEGEFISLLRWQIACVLSVVAFGLLITVAGAVLLWSFARRNETTLSPLGLFALALVGSQLWFWGSYYFVTRPPTSLLLCVADWYFLTRPPSLVLGVDRLQWLAGNHVRWELRYEHIADLSLFAIPLAPRKQFLGIRLKNPEEFDILYPRQPRAWRARMRLGWKRYFACDLAVPLWGESEPPERVLEATLRCLHRFRALTGQ